MSIEISGWEQLYFWKWLLRSRLSFRFKDGPDGRYMATMLDWDWTTNKGQICLTVVL